MSDIVDDRTPEANYWPQFFAGFFGLMLIHAISVVAPLALGAGLMAINQQDAGSVVLGATFYWVALLGVGQVVYAVPIGLLTLLTGKRAIAAGVGAGAAFTFLMSGLLWGCATLTFAAAFAACIGMLSSSGFH
jgi:hypothetical protein